MIKVTINLRRRIDMSHEDFIKYHQNIHLPLFKSLPEVKQYVRRYTHFYARQEVPELPLPAYLCVTRIWLDDLESLYKLFGSHSYIQTILASEKKFLDMSACSVMVS